MVCQKAGGKKQRSITKEKLQISQQEPLHNNMSIGLKMSAIRFKIGIFESHSSVTSLTLVVVITTKFENAPKFF